MPNHTVAIAGCGPRGRHHAEAFLAHPDRFDLVATCDLDEERLRVMSSELGIAREGRRFTAHVTLGRVKDRRACPPMDVISGAVADQDFGRVAVDSMALMKSDLRPDGAVYTRLHAFPLGAQRNS